MPEVFQSSHPWVMYKLPTMLLEPCVYPPFEPPLRESICYLGSDMPTHTHRSRLLREHSPPPRDWQKEWMKPPVKSNTYYSQQLSPHHALLPKPLTAYSVSL